MTETPIEVGSLETITEICCSALFTPAKEKIMTIEYTGRHMTVTSQHKAQAEAGLERIGRVTRRCTSAHVILTEEKHRHIAEVIVNCSGDELVARCESTAIEVALHDALRAVERQAVHEKQRYESVRQHPRPIPAPAA
jgi:putative sigma-54 modulation protein